jgi:hypothetical protein
MKGLLAQKIENPVGPKFESGTSFFQSFIPALIGTGFVLGVLFFFFYMMIGAIQWITSGGDKTALEGARGKITSAIVGVIILLSLFALLKIIEDFFGINILTLDIGPLVIE